MAFGPHATSDGHAEIARRSTARGAISGELEVRRKVGVPQIHLWEQAQELGLRGDDKASDLPMGNVYALILPRSVVTHTLSV